MHTKMGIFRYIVFVITLAEVLPAFAVCLDPKTLGSGYHVALDEEVVSTESIVIGKVINKQALQEDSSDPYGITAHIVTVQVLQQLKGSTSKIITIRVENDSSRYWMEVAEKHLLFLTKEGEHFFIDSCGSSSVLPEGDAVINQVLAKLAGASHAP